MNIVINKKVQVINLGMIDYKEAWNFQEELFDKTVRIKIENRKKQPGEQTPTPNTLIFCQHPHVYTLGKSGKEENLLVKEEELENIDATFYKINRGGDITYHGPGQIVCYPILDLENFFTDIHKYLRLLEESVIQTCAVFGIKTGRIDGLTGVWINDQTNPRKIAAMGVKSSRWVTMHGLSFNVTTDLSYYSSIIPCGIHDKEVTSLSKESGEQQDIEVVRVELEEQFLHLFEMDRR